MIIGRRLFLLFRRLCSVEKGNITAKASITRNYRFPTLNDLYFLPGGNTDLKRESGFTYEAGLSFAVGKDNVYTLSGSASWFDQHVNDWIIWLPNFKGIILLLISKKCTLMV